MSTHKKNKAERKVALSQICDADSYLPIVEECLDDKQKKELRPIHMANALALTAELFLLHYTAIATAFERCNGLEITFKVKLAQEKDTVEVAFKPVDTFKDSASANLPEEDDPSQPTFDFAPAPQPPAAEPEPVEVEAEVLGLPAPALGLPAPDDEFRRTCMEDDENLSDAGDDESAGEEE